ncbi:MAG: RNA polymerase sigma factor RpoH [Alphaproteobacteria bacterium]|jgi:RNA polymerase sigma-32 factor|nr:RNA polymerase sigma factor RpoH [Alphaproteobacteria bacterium]
MASNSQVPSIYNLSPEGNLSRYLKEINKFPVLTSNEEYELATSWQEEQNLEAAHQLVTSHLRLVAKIASGYSGYGLPMGEIISEGNIGLMKSVKKFQPEKGFRLATYAMWWIKAAINEYVLRSWSLVKIGTTSAQKKLFFNLKKIKNRISKIDNNSLSNSDIKQISSELGVSEQDVIEMDIRLEGKETSLNASIKSSENDSGEWQDFIEDTNSNQEIIIADIQEAEYRKKMLTQAMAKLNDREKDIIYQRKLKDPIATLEDLSKQYNISIERVRQIESKAMEKLHCELRGMM